MSVKVSSPADGTAAAAHHPMSTPHSSFPSTAVWWRRPIKATSVHSGATYKVWTVIWNNNSSSSSKKGNNKTTTTTASGAGTVKFNTAATPVPLLRWQFSRGCDSAVPHIGVWLMAPERQQQSSGNGGRAPPPMLLYLAGDGWTNGQERADFVLTPFTPRDLQRARAASLLLLQPFLQIILALKESTPLLS